MDNQTIDEILTKLENEVAQDVANRIHQNRSGRSPKSSHAEAKAKLSALLVEAELKGAEMQIAEYDTLRIISVMQLCNKRIKELEKQREATE